MAAQIRVLRRRIRSTQSIKKITRAMELIATSRIAKARARVDESRPYAEQATMVLTQLAQRAALDHPLLVERENTKRAAVLVVTSDRGQAGGYNNNVLKEAEALQKLLREQGAKVLLYEAGENLRFDAYAVDAGVLGVRRVLAALGMTEPVDEAPVEPSLECRSSGWVRARRTGILHLDAHLGQKVSDGERLGTLFDSFGKTLRAVYANRDGIVIGRTEAPLVNSGDAVVHIAE